MNHPLGEGEFGVVYKGEILNIGGVATINQVLYHIIDEYCTKGSSFYYVRSLRGGGM